MLAPVSTVGLAPLRLASAGPGSADVLSPSSKVSALEGAARARSGVASLTVPRNDRKREFCCCGASPPGRGREGGQRRVALDSAVTGWSSAPEAGIA